MQITTTSVNVGAGGDSRKAAILRQIRNLEKQKAELVKRLGELGKSYADAASAVPAMAGDTGTVRINGTSVAGGDSFAAAAGGSPAAMLTFIQGDNQSSAGVMDFAEMDDPKEIAKLIQLIDLQIMNLQRQLGDDALHVLTAAREDEPAALSDARLTTHLTESVLAPQADSHLDRYL
ncbi:MAG: hypothetical protein LIP77_11795 [Planctomycetes bacterium]|nr:hypothetical protein [Planctomycetota bacterium]